MLKISILAIVMVVVGWAAAPTLVTYAQPQWETYENEDCGIAIDHQYEDDVISSDIKNKFRIWSMGELGDPDSMNVVIDVTCSNPATPITQEMMESVKLEAMTSDSKLEGRSAVIYKDISFDKYMIDGEDAGSVKAGGSTGIGDTGWVEHIILTNHGDRQYKINLQFVGDEGISGFGKIYSTLEEHILDSIVFTN